MKKTYTFGPGLGTEGNAEMRELLGGKGANLAEMANLNLPIPPGFTITTEVCNEYLHSGKGDDVVTDLLKNEVYIHLNDLKEHFGYFPLVSVRSGARVSMPGMMDTILNVGLTSESLPEWAERIGKRAALDSYRRLMQMMGDVVFGIPKEEFEGALGEVKKTAEVTHDHELSVAQLDTLIGRYKIVYQTHSTEFPDTFIEQLEWAITAVFESWNCDRAKAYREMHGYPDEWGTAVNIQSMVFGNLNDKSCTGVLFSRNPSNGDPVITGEFLVNAQGEDVVAGIRTPDPLDQMNKWNPEAYQELCDHTMRLEEYYKDMQDVEFTVQAGKLYILQCRNGKRSAKAAFRIASDMVSEGVLTTEEALTRVTVAQYLALKTPAINKDSAGKPQATGIAAGGGVVTGRVAFTEYQVKQINSEEGHPAILVGKETTPDDIVAMNLSVGILTQTGGLTSHAAVVARGMDKVCVVGCTELAIVNGTLIMGDGTQVQSGDLITIDGSTGNVWIGAKEVIPGEVNYHAAHLLTEGSGSLLCGDAHPPEGLLLVTKDYCLRLGTGTFNEDPVKELRALGEKVTGTLYVEFDGPFSNLDAEDRLMIQMLGKNPTKEERDWINHHMTLLGEAGREVVALLPGTVQVSTLKVPENVKLLKAAGTLKDLLSGNGIPDEEFIKNVVGDTKTYNTLKAMMKAHGKTIAEPVNPVKEEKLAFQIFS